jgi:hypothetical protein
MPLEDFNALAQEILDAKRKAHRKVLETYLSSVASGPRSTGTGLGQQFKNWFWGSEVQEQKLTELTPSDMMKSASAQSEHITDSEFLSRLHDRATHVPGLQPLALKAAECARSYLAELVTRSTTKLLHRAQFCQEEACSRRVQREATSKEADDLKASRCQWIEEITEASRAYSSSCVI